MNRSIKERTKAANDFADKFIGAYMIGMLGQALDGYFAQAGAEIDTGIRDKDKESAKRKQEIRSTLSLIEESGFVKDVEEFLNDKELDAPSLSNAWKLSGVTIPIGSFLYFLEEISFETGSNYGYPDSFAIVSIKAKRRLDIPPSQGKEVSLENVDKLILVDYNSALSYTR